MNIRARVLTGFLALLCNSALAEQPAGSWELAFSEPGAGDWKEHWFVEGLKASVKYEEGGMVFSSGPVPKEQASHAVLWTKRSFEGDIRIEYDYTRLDSMTASTAVNILYIQATGLGTEESPTDIFLSTEQREVPWMKSYFLNMNALHISYATTGPKRANYVAARRYPAPDRKSFMHGTMIEPYYEDIDLFKPGETYHITATKEGNRLTFTAEREGKTHTFEWDTSAFPPVTEGRIGLRHMWARSSRYENFRVFQKSDKADYFTDNGFSNTIATMQHPAGEHYQGVTYVAYQGPLEDPYVAAYEHETGKWSGPFKAGESALGKKPGEKIDNHGKPALIVDREGYIHLVFGGHGGLPSHGTNELGNTHKGQMKHAVSSKPLDISSWEALDNITPFGTYNQFVKMDNGDLYLFYRHGAHRSNWVYQKSSDNGRSFGPKVSILKHQPRTDEPGVHDSWYAWFTNGQGDEIIATYNYHRCREPNHIGERHNGYYMVMDTDDHVWRNVKGERLDVPLTKDYADEKTLVVDSGDLWTVRGTTTLDPAGKPHITLEVGEGMGLHHGGPKQTNHYRWTGQEWYTAGSTDLPIKSVGDLLVPSPGEVSLLLGGDEDVAWWHSTDGGKSFAKGESLIRHEKMRFSITSMIRNAHPDARVMAAGNERGVKSLFRKMYLLGDHGPVKRLKAEAHQID